MNDLSAPLRVVRLITWLPLGGIERRLVAVASRLDREVFSPEVICLRERGPLADHLETAGVPVDVCRLCSRLSPRGIWRLSRRLRGAAVVHSHMYRANVPGTIAARLAGVPVILGQIHNIDTWERTSQRRWDRRTARRRTGTIAVSESVRRNWCGTLGIPESHCHVIHNGVDLAPFEAPFDRDGAREELGLSRQEVALVCVARLHPQKNHPGLLDAIAALPGDLPPWRLLLVGEGPARAGLEEIVRARGLSDRVRFLGARDDVSHLLRACDVSVLASEKEGFSNVVIESLAAGLPVVATDVGGNAEAVEEGESGFLVPASDMAALGERLARLIADEPLRRRMGDAARRRARGFGLEAMVRRVERLYLECLARVNPALVRGPRREALEARRESDT